MTDPLPADVREYLEVITRTDRDVPLARSLLAKYPKPQPEPAWQPGDVILRGDETRILDEQRWWGTGSGGRWTSLNGHDYSDADLIARDGRRVHPPRFVEHAADLANVAHDLEARGLLQWATILSDIAADLAGDNNA